MRVSVQNPISVMSCFWVQQPDGLACSLQATRQQVLGLKSKIIVHSDFSEIGEIYARWSRKKKKKTVGPKPWP